MQALTLYFLCGRDSQKATNLARDDRVSLTLDHDTSDVMAIQRAVDGVARQACR
jgi:hypothetical protein